MAAQRRALHFVFKVGNRKETARFYTDILGMKVLRHEEFEKGCEAACNGPYDGRWSKSMVGFGPENSHFVVELTYNYGIGSYTLGNDFQSITINSSDCIENAKRHNWPVFPHEGGGVLEAPGGYKFVVNTQGASGDPVQKVTLSCSDLQTSLGFWRDKLDMKVYCEDKNSATLGYADNQAKLELVEVGNPVDRAKAFGRIAFSCPNEQLSGLEARMKAGGQTILTPLVSLDTPGKATVQVIILADPDGHEICFVGDEAFLELSQVDPDADQLLETAMTSDKSDEWFARKGRTKADA